MPDPAPSQPSKEDGEKEEPEPDGSDDPSEGSGSASFGMNGWGNYLKNTLTQETHYTFVRRSPHRGGRRYALF